MNLLSPITVIKGIGEKTAALFHRMGIYTVEELLSYYPRTYEQFQEPVTFANLEEGRIQAVLGSVRRKPELVRGGQIVTMSLEEFGTILQLRWFHMPYLRNTIKPGSCYIFRGMVQKKREGAGGRAGQRGSQESGGRYRLLMDHPQMYKPEEYQKQVSVLQPMYSLTKGVSNNTVTKAVRQALSELDLSREYLPEGIRGRHQLPEYNFAIQAIHFPTDEESLSLARRRLVFDEFFLFLLALRRMREQVEEEGNSCPIYPCKQTRELIEGLPYRLTDAQQRVWGEVEADLFGPGMMSRLIQGDVGSGKTIIAILALLAAAAGGYQGAMMVPTEVLARQQYETVQKILEEYGFPYRVMLLTGSLTTKERRRVYERIELGMAHIVIGTHALIQSGVQFDNLGLVVTDEQHRFGVRQRELLTEKGYHPHVLVMSATPIPRTLAMIVYGDLRISVINQLPADRLPIKNCVVDESYRPKAYAFMLRQIQEGRQVYIICPMVEENPEMEMENVTDYAQSLQEEFPAGTQIACLHGRMKALEKAEIMERFAAGEIQILVSTTVVEVGVNVPNATVMMVENAERFGLAQLHQLRGRVGRGKHQSYCIFVSGSDNPDTRKRLEILNQSNDGFFIASEDLKLRGPGDLFGLRQSGLMEFRIGDIFTDAGILQAASQEAEEILTQDPQLEKAEHQALREKLARYQLRDGGGLQL